MHAILIMHGIFSICGRMLNGCHGVGAYFMHFHINHKPPVISAHVHAQSTLALHLNTMLNITTHPSMPTVLSQPTATYVHVFCVIVPYAKNETRTYTHTRI